MLKQGIIAISLLTAWNLHAQDVTPYTPGAMPEGIVYYLPKTELEIKVTVTQTTYTPGEFCQYADRYLRLQNVAPKPHVQWNLQSIEVTPKGVPNPERAYSIKLKDKSVASEVQLTKEGIIRAINTNVPEDVIPQKAAVKKTERVNPRNFMTEEILMAGSSIKMAELVAKEIYNIRESKNSLTRGQADYMPKDGDALQIMLDNLNAQEKALTEMFAGFTEVTEKTFTFTISPDEDIKSKVICRFSSKLGILNADNLAGEPVYISITSQNTLPPADEEGMKKKQLNGVIYNIPGKALVTIKDTHKVYYEHEISFAQLGETEVLVNSLFNKKINTRVIFDPITGGIVKIDKD